MRAGAIALGRRWLLAAALVCGLGIAGMPAGATPPSDDDAVAYRNYTLNCMGCHGPAGERVPGKIPPLQGALGMFVHTPAGRQFIIKVPGASNSALSDEELAQVTNLLLKRYSAQTLPADFKPYTAAEIAGYRRPAYQDVVRVRREVIGELHKQGVPLPYDY